MVDLRCPECLTWMQGCFSKDDMKELDRLQTAGREEIQSAYEHQVAEAMEALIDCLQAALALDLVGPDDFAPRARRLPARRVAQDHPPRVSRGHPSADEGGRDDGIRVRRHGARGRHQLVPRDRRDGRAGRHVSALAGLRNVFLPVVVIELVLGVLVGPQVLDLAHVNDFTDFFSSLGLGMLFFFAGYEIDLGRIAGLPLRLALAGWAFSLVIAYTLGGILAALGVVVSLVYVGSALATTAIGTLIPVLSDTGELKTEFGRYLLAAGAVGEFGPILLLTLVLSTQSALHNALILVAFIALAVGRRRARRPLGRAHDAGDRADDRDERAARGALVRRARVRARAGRRPTSGSTSCSAGSPPA